MRRIVGTIAITILALTMRAAVAAEPAYTPKAVKFDPARLATYSNRELMDLMSPPSFALNVQSGSGYYDVMPPDFDIPKPDGPAFAATPTGTWLEPKVAALAYVPAVGNELVKRHPVAEVMDAFLHSDDRAQQAWMLDALYNMPDPKVDGLLRPYMTSALDDNHYFAAIYFSRHCDLAALRILNGNYNAYRIPSMEKAGVAMIFGVCRYMPAVPNLVASLDAAILNLAQQAHASLTDVYPDAHISAQTAGDAKQDWRDYLQKHR